MADAVGLVLAAGAGTRYGMPKAMVREADGTSWCGRAVDALVEGGCQDVVVVLGALAEEAMHLVPAGAGVVVARDWAEGQGASLRAGLRAVGPSSAELAVVTLVDLTGLTSDAVLRVADGCARASLVRATYDGRPGHPVVIGRDHWAAFTGTRRPGEVLDDLDVREIDCTDLGGGDDVDTRGAA